MYTKKKLKLFRIIKRFEDIVFSLSVLIFLSPIIILSSLVSFLLQGCPLLYVSRRMVGIEKEINIAKFRTMVKDAKSEKYGLEKKYMKEGFLDIPMSS